MSGQLDEWVWRMGRLADEWMGGTGVEISFDSLNLLFVFCWLSLFQRYPFMNG